MLLVIGFLLALVSVTIAVALGLSADGAGHPSIWASCFAAVSGRARRPARDDRDPRRRDSPSRRRMSAAARFDELIHPATRLSVVALLAAADWADFAFIRDQIGLSDSALSKQLATLEEAGYVAIDRPVSERRRRVRARLTPLGRERFAAHVAALQGIIAAAPS